MKNKRDQNDIALIETSKSFDFTHREKVSPICLPSKHVFIMIDLICLPSKHVFIIVLKCFIISALETEDTDVPVAASGWGQLYEQDKRVR